MPGREGSPGLDGNEVHSVCLLYAQGRTDVTTPRKETRKQTHQIMFPVNSVVIEPFYLLSRIDSCVHPQLFIIFSLFYVLFSFFLIHATHITKSHFFYSFHLQGLYGVVVSFCSCLLIISLYIAKFKKTDVPLSFLEVAECLIAILKVTNFSNVSPCFKQT